MIMESVVTDPRLTAGVRRFRDDAADAARDHGAGRGRAPLL